MTWVVGAGIDGGAANLGQRIWSGAWRTGTLGPLVLWQTDGIGATRVISADVHTLVAQSVTELGGWAVLIGQTTDCSAANHRVGGVSLELAWRTGASGGVVLGDTDSLRSTGDGGAGRDTLLQRSAAHLLLPTLGIIGALVLGGQVTSIPVLGVARVAFETVTESLVVAGSALGVWRTGEELADWSTAEDTEAVWFTHLVLAALVVIGTTGHRGQLTLVGQRVPDVVWTALTEWSVVPHHALLRATTAHHPAGVHTALLTTDVDAADGAWLAVRGGGAGHLAGTSRPEVQGVASEAVLTDACAVVVVCHTSGVGATLDIATGVHTPVLALD